MNAPRRTVEIPAALRLAFHVVGTYLTTTADRAATPLWTDCDGPLPFVGRWLSKTFFFALVVEGEEAPRAAIAELVAALGAARFSVRAGSTEQIGRVRDALGAGRRNPAELSFASAGLYADCLPARETRARIGVTPLASRTVVAHELRTLTTGPWGQAVEAHKIGCRHPDSGVMGLAVLFVGHGWRAILRAEDAEKLDALPPEYRPEAPCPLVCSTCPHTGGFYADEFALREGARRRRWERRELDEGDAHVCRQCAANGQVPT